MLYIVSLHTKGWYLETEIHSENIITVRLLDKKIISKIQLLKVKFYNFIERISVIRLKKHYVIYEDDLPTVEVFFSREIYPRFLKTRREIFKSITERWNDIESSLSKTISIDKIVRMKPNDEQFIDLEYFVFPLEFYINGLESYAQKFDKEEYLPIKNRILESVNDLREEIAAQFRLKLNAILETANALRSSSLNIASKNASLARLQKYIRDTKIIANYMHDKKLQEEFENVLSQISDLDLPI